MEKKLSDQATEIRFDEAGKHRRNLAIAQMPRDQLPRTVNVVGRTDVPYGEMMMTLSPRFRKNLPRRDAA